MKANWKKVKLGVKIITACAPIVILACDMLIDKEKVIEKNTRHFSHRH